MSIIRRLKTNCMGSGSPFRSQTTLVGDKGLELSSKTSDSIQNGPGSGAESGAVGPVPMFWLNLGLGAEWAALSAATQAAVSELPLAALRELADLTSDIPNQFAATTAKIDGPSQ